MRKTRRSVLGGIGALTVGGGAIFGSGAFSSVTANRNANISVVTDSNAELGLSGDGNYITESDTSGGAGESMIEFQFSNLNDNATTTFSGLLTITNNATDGNDKTVYIDSSGSVGGAVDFREDAADAGTSIVGSTNAVTLSSTNGSGSNPTSVTLDVVFDSTSGDPSGVSTITIVADAV